MSLFIATPCYGGMAGVPYLKSLLSLQESLLEVGLPFDMLLTSNESLVQRARNTSVATYLKTDFERLMFIDADIEFSPEDVAKLWNQDEDVGVAAYPMKRKDCPLSAWRDGALVSIEDETEVFEVDYAGTGFMMIKRHVFDAMRKEYSEREHMEGHVGACFSWFDPRVEDGIYLSEDYAFCQDWRKMGGRVMLDPTIRLKHYGVYGYG